MLKSHQDSKFFQGRKTQQLYKLQLQNVAPKGKKKKHCGKRQKLTTI